MSAAFWPVVVVGAFFVWVVYVAMDLEVPAFLAKWYHEPGNSITAAIWVGSIFAIAVTYFSPRDSILGSLLNDAIVVAVTVTILDELNRRRTALEEKDRIIRQVGSHSNDFALDAIKQVREKKWHEDDSLAEKNFQYADLRKANLAGAYLAGTDFTMANLQGANMNFADLADTNFLGANLEGATLHDAVLLGAYLQATNLNGAALRNADMAWAYLVGQNLSNADLSFATLDCAKMAFTNLQDANLYGISFFDAYLGHANLRRANLEKAILVRTNLWMADLREANLIDANLYGADLEQTKLEAARYSQYTEWPKYFDPQSVGAILVEWDQEKQEWFPVKDTVDHQRSFDDFRVVIL